MSVEKTSLFGTQRIQLNFFTKLSGVAALCGLASLLFRDRGAYRYCSETAASQSDSSHCSYEGGQQTSSHPCKGGFHSSDLKVTSVLEDLQDTEKQEGAGNPISFFSPKVSSVSRVHSVKSWCVIMQISKSEPECLAGLPRKIGYLMLGTSPEKVSKEKIHLLCKNHRVIYVGKDLEDH